MRETSLLTYRQIIADGTITKLKLLVYSAIIHNENLTAAELHQKEFPYKQISTIRARITELNDLGVIYSTKARKCKITRRWAHVWESSGNLPNKEKAKDKKPASIKKSVVYILLEMRKKGLLSITPDDLKKIANEQK
tara:strand:+ start:2447 stop:2857 length:411 start_codon:yes stop_codon:yes gene_type:complete